VRGRDEAGQACEGGAGGHKVATPEMNARRTSSLNGARGGSAGESDMSASGMD
jgi:hypothetical protein